MKKYLKQLICALAILCLVAGFAPAQAEAATIKGSYRIHTIKQKKTEEVVYFHIFRKIFRLLQI